MTVPLDGPEFDRWRRQADTTIDTAALVAGGGQWAWACFLAEQAAQFAAKALLHGIGSPAWGDDLVVLLRQVAHELGPEIVASVVDPGARLSRHYIPARYPDAHPEGLPGAHYGAADADLALADARAVLASVDRAWAGLSKEG